MNNKMLFLISMLLISMDVSSANQFATVHLDSVNAFGTGETIVLGISAADFPTTCRNQETPKRMYAVVNQVGVTQKGLDYMLSTSLAAVSTKNRVYIRFNDTTENCYVSRIMVFGEQ